MRSVAIFLFLALHGAAAMRQHDSDEPVIGGRMFFINDNDQCYETNIDKKYRSGLRSMINDLIEGDCSSEGYEVFMNEKTIQLQKPYWLGPEPVPIAFAVHKPTERQLKKWEREEAAEKAREEKMKKEMEEELARLPAEARTALEKMQKGEELNAEDKSALEKLEKAEMERLKKAQNNFRQSEDSNGELAEQKTEQKTDQTAAATTAKKGKRSRRSSTDRNARKAARKAKREARRGAKKEANKEAMKE